MLEPAAQPTGLDAHHRIRLWIEAFVAAEDLDPDGVGLDAIGASCKRFLDDVFQKAPELLRYREFRASDNVFKLGTHGHWRRSFRRSRGWQRAGSAHGHPPIANRSGCRGQRPRCLPMAFSNVSYRSILPNCTIWQPQSDLGLRTLSC